MRWDKDKSILLSKIFTAAIAVILLALCIASPWSRLFSLQLSYKNLRVNWYTVSLVAFALPAYAALWQLYRLLGNISRGQVFVAANVRCLRVISWCCFAAAAVFFFSGFYSTSWIVLFVAAVFGGLILRVVKNVFAAAVALQDEQDLTI